MGEAIDLKLIGGLILGRSSVVAAMDTWFERLMSEIDHTGDMARFILYASGPDESPDALFAAMDVEDFHHIPEGMQGWELTDDSVAIIEPNSAVSWRGGLDWRWHKTSAIGAIAGEFDSVIPHCGSVRREFRIDAHAYFGVPEHHDDDVQLVEYDPSWPRKYAEMEKLLKQNLGPEIAKRIEHYGSTAIPEMPAKPIVDILVEIPSFAQARKAAIPLFNKPGCEYWWYSNHMCFIIRDEFLGKRKYHIHMAPAGHPIWEGLAFRDYLRKHQKEADCYAETKMELAERHRNDREAYTEAKTAYVRRVTTKALEMANR